MFKIIAFRGNGNVKNEGFACGEIFSHEDSKAQRYLLCKKLTTNTQIISAPFYSCIHATLTFFVTYSIFVPSWLNCIFGTMRIFYFLICFFSFQFLAPQLCNAGAAGHTIKSASFKSKLLKGEAKKDCSLEKIENISQQRLQHEFFPVTFSSYKFFAVNIPGSIISLPPGGVPTIHFICPKHHFW